MLRNHRFTSGGEIYIYKILYNWQERPALGPLVRGPFISPPPAAPSKRFTLKPRPLVLSQQLELVVLRHGDEDITRAWNGGYMIRARLYAEEDALIYS